MNFINLFCFVLGTLHFSEQDIEGDKLLLSLRDYALTCDLGNILDNITLVSTTRLFLLILVKHSGINPYKMYVFGHFLFIYYISFHLLCQTI